MDLLIEQVLKGHRLSIARLISKIESRSRELPELIKKLYPHTGKARVLGITGPPGAGKSTLVDQLIIQFRKKGKKVAVAAIDPSSPFSGGAILGDRIRMQRHASDEGVYIRSLGTRGKHGGLSHSTKEVVMALDAAQFDVILVETVGVGQTELDILKLAQTVIVTLVPESGDGIQVMKAGLMEIADIFAVNKGDRPEADRLVKELITMVGLLEKKEWVIPVKKTQAHQGVGIEDLVEAFENHQTFLSRSGKGELKTRSFLQSEVGDILTERLNQSILDSFNTQSGKELLNNLIQRQVDPYTAADIISNG